jgi:hypothetical protein
MIFNLNINYQSSLYDNIILQSNYKQNSNKDEINEMLRIIITINVNHIDIVHFKN